MATIKKGLKKAQLGSLLRTATRVAGEAAEKTAPKIITRFSSDAEKIAAKAEKEGLLRVNGPKPLTVGQQARIDAGKQLYDGPRAKRAERELRNSIDARTKPKKKLSREDELDASYRKNGGAVKKKMKNGGSLSGLKASNKRVGPIDPKGAFTKVQERTLAGAKGKAKLTENKELGATKMKNGGCMKCGGKMKK